MNLSFVWSRAGLLSLTHAFVYFFKSDMHVHSFIIYSDDDYIMFVCIIVYYNIITKKLYQFDKALKCVRISSLMRSCALSMFTSESCAGNNANNVAHSVLFAL